MKKLFLIIGLFLTIFLLSQVNAEDQIVVPVDINGDTIEEVEVKIKNLNEEIKNSSPKPKFTIIKGNLYEIL